MAFLKAADAIEMAMGIETSGETFYRVVAQKAKMEGVQALFEDLAVQEVRHYATFKKLGETLRDRLMMSADEWDEYQGYLEATVQSALFEGPDRALAAAEEVEDEKEALRMAMGFEKETLLFFYNLRDIVSQADAKTIDKIIAEEKAHLRRLAGLLKQ
ncbi:MAG: ferritin family protein [Anaerolineae bacterium]|nr:ferritin family protein [Anaerolineae bacterium]